MKFEIYKDAKGEWRWRAKASNGRIIATSGEGYVQWQGAANGIESLRKNMAKSKVYKQETFDG